MDVGGMIKGGTGVGRRTWRYPIFMLSYCSMVVNSSSHAGMSYRTQRRVNNVRSIHQREKMGEIEPKIEQKIHTSALGSLASVRKVFWSRCLHSLTLSASGSEAIAVKSQEISNPAKST